MPDSTHLIAAGPSGSRLFVKQSGPANAADQGQTVVFLHGLGSASSVAFAKIVDAPALERFRTVLVDLPGFGRSDAPMDWSYRIEDHADIVRHVIQDHLCDTVTLVGHSMGGSIAIALASAHPALVRRLIALEPNLDSRTGAVSGRVAAQTERAYSACGHRALLALTRRQEGTEGLSADAYSRTLAQANPIATHRSAVSLIAARAPSFREHFRTLPMTRILISGERSIQQADGNIDPSIPHLIVPSAGHAMMTENRAGFINVLVQAMTID